MAARQFFHAEDRTETSTTSTTYGDKVALTFTPDANSDYILIWCAVQKNASNITDDSKVRFFHDTASTVINETTFEGSTSSAPLDYIPTYGIKKQSFGASPASQTYSIEFAAETAGNTINCKEASIIAIKMDAADQYAESEAISSTTATTFQDKTTLTFTPASAGDYLIICSSEWQVDVAGGAMEMKLLDDTSTDRGLTLITPTEILNWLPHGTFIRLNLSAASKTFKTQFRNVSGAVNVDMQRSRIFAMRLDTLDNNYYVESRTRSTTTSTTYQDKATLTATPLAQDHLKLYCGIEDGNNAAVNYWWRSIEGAAVEFETVAEAANNDVTRNDRPGITFRLDTLAASSTTWKTQWRSETTAGTAGFEESAISILQLTVAAAAVDQINVETSLPPLGRINPYSFDGWQAAPLPDDNEVSATRAWDLPNPFGVYREPHQGVQVAPLPDDNEVSVSRVWELLPPTGVYREPHQGEQFMGERPDFVEPDQETINRSWLIVPDGVNRTMRYEGFQAAPLPDDNEISVTHEAHALPPLGRIDPYNYDGAQLAPLPDDNEVSVSRTWTEVPAGRNPHQLPWDGQQSVAGFEQDFQAPVLTDVPLGRNPFMLPWDGFQAAPLPDDAQVDTPIAPGVFPTFHFPRYRREPHFIYEGFTFSPTPEDAAPPAVQPGVYRPTIRPRRR